MSYLIDTNVISEIRLAHSNKNVVQWIQKIGFEKMYLSTLTLGEIRHGIEKAKDLKKEKLKIWLEIELPQLFGQRILNIDHKVADRWGRLKASINRTLPIVDSLLAATALHHDLCLVTRNTRDFSFPGLELFNPWEN